MSRNVKLHNCIIWGNSNPSSLERRTCAHTLGPGVLVLVMRLPSHFLHWSRNQITTSKYFTTMGGLDGLDGLST